MNYYNFVNTILETSKSHKLVYEVGEGDIYEHLNSGDHKYPCVFLTVQNVDSNGTQMTVTGSLFYVDALLSDTSNKLQIQSTGMTTLQQIFMRLMDNYPDFDLRIGRYTPFDEKFADLCAGVFSNFTISFMDDICIVNDDIFEGDIPTPPTPPTPPGPEPPTPPEPTGKYMTMTVDDNAGETIISPNVTGSITPNLQYRINNGEWNDFIFGTTADIHVFAGDVVQFKGVNENYISTSDSKYLNFAISDSVHLSGNVMSLIDGVGETLVIPNEYCFTKLFSNSNVKTVSKDFLPATKLTMCCYAAMFWNCSNLVKAPELHATTLAYGCYQTMFKGCTSLTQAPELPATTLEVYCYNGMFENCTSLVTAPELPATTLVMECYRFMFSGCTKLNYVKSLATTGIINEFGMASSSIEYWLQNVASTGTFVKKYGVEYLINSPSGIPQGWTVEEIDAPIPEPKYMTITVDDAAGETTIKPTVKGSLPTLNLQYCINNREWNDFIVGTTADIHVVAGDVVQFKGVNESGISTSENDYLNFAISGNPVSLSGNVMSLIDGVGATLEIPCDYCFHRLFRNSAIKTVSSDFLPATTLKNYCYSVMFRECTALTTAPALPATTLANHCYWDMFRGCTSLTTVPALPATKLSKQCYSYMFCECTSLTKAHEILPATTLDVFCYEKMFNGCTALTTAPELPATTLANYCYFWMFDGCTSLVKAPELPATTLTEGCYKGMFRGCTSLVTAPVLNATTLAESCYNHMFYECRKLNYVKCLSTEITATYALTNWLWGVASKGTFVKKYGVSYETGGSGIPQGWTVEEIDAPIPPEPEGKYMTITVDGNAGETIIVPKVDGPKPTRVPDLQYRVNNGDWKNFIVYKTDDIHVFAGDVVQFKGNNPKGLTISYIENVYFEISGSVHLSGNVMSLIDGKGETLVIPNEYCFYELFYNCSSIKTVSRDFLPATTLKNGCYSRMFLDCTSLKNAPELPATTLANSCYLYMFKDCISLVKAPELPATTLASYCYEEMFENCSSLVTAPVLPATTLVNHCYYNMFFNCRSLNYVKSLATNITENTTISSLNNWLYSVATKGTFVKPAGVSYESGDSGIPVNWTVHNIY